MQPSALHASASASSARPRTRSSRRRRRPPASAAGPARRLRLCRGSSLIRPRWGAVGSATFHLGRTTLTGRPRRLATRNRARARFMRPRRAIDHGRRSALRHCRGPAVSRRVHPPRLRRGVVPLYRTFSSRHPFIARDRAAGTSISRVVTTRSRVVSTRRDGRGFRASSRAGHALHVRFDGPLRSYSRSERDHAFARDAGWLGRR